MFDETEILVYTIALAVAFVVLCLAVVIWVHDRRIKRIVSGWLTCSVCDKPISIINAILDELAQPFCSYECGQKAWEPTASEQEPDSD